MSPTPQTALLSLTPLEPVLVFPNPSLASLFHARYQQSRILPSSPSEWVYLPLPPGLLRVRTAKRGDVAFDFDSERHAGEFNEGIGGVGRIWGGGKRARVVYLGVEKV